MHLKSYPKFQKKELELESSNENSRGLHASQQGDARTDRGSRQHSSLGGTLSSSAVGRRPLGVLSTNTLCNANTVLLTAKVATEAPCANRAWSGKTSSVKMLTSSLLLLSSVSGNELTINTSQDSEGPLDIWTVIKPGNTKEKIAVYAAQQRDHANDASGYPGTGQSSPLGFRTLSKKAKGYWEGEGSMAKRRKWSADLSRQSALMPHLRPTKQPFLDMGVRHGAGSENLDGSEREEDGQDGGKTLSVVEIVAYFDQQLGHSKPCALRTSGNSSLAKASLLPGADQPGGQEASESPDEEPTSIRVQDMVAKLESECLKEQCERMAGGLKRNNSLRRNVGRVLLAGADAHAVTAQSRLDPAPASQHELHESPKGCEKPGSPLVHSETAVVVQEGFGSRVPVNVGKTRASCDSQSCGAIALEHGDERTGREPLCPGGHGWEEVRAKNEPCLGQRQEPLPGRLFFSMPSSTQEQEALAPAMQLSQVAPCEGKPARFAYDPLVEHYRRQEAEGKSGAVGPERSQFPLRRVVSHEFLEMRFKIQLLLQPQQYMAILPHHIMVKIFGLLPTKTLAALKCTCHYFKFIIESYSVRPADSRWVCDPRYKDDPCKQCKKRYGRGDVSLCRWHHKPYCQALPYGPGYWMCCYGTCKDTPGCNIGLHDNQWVPAFHNINMPIYKKARDSEESS